jgi:hypothetical protein
MAHFKDPVLYCQRPKGINRLEYKDVLTFLGLLIKILMMTQRIKMVEGPNQNKVNNIRNLLW